MMAPSSSRESKGNKISSTKSRNGSIKSEDGGGSGIASSSGLGGKKLSSLSSFQMTLNFSIPKLSHDDTSKPNVKSFSGNGSRTSAPNESSSIVSSSSSQDRRLMPPPPAGITTKTKANAKSSAKGKGKAPDDAILIDDEDEEDEELYGSSHEYDMWTERFAPLAEADLAPGKARIARVKNWLHMSLYGYPLDRQSTDGLGSSKSRDTIRKYKRILLLTGPAGAGKTTTVRVLAKEMGIELMDWGEGVEESSLGTGLDRESSTSKMLSFLSRHSYNPLTLSQGSSSTATPSRPRVILITGLPNLTHIPTKEAFHAALLSFCQNFSSSSCPMIIIHSHAGSGGKAEESWMDRERGGREGAMEVVGRAVKDGPWSEEIEFIPVAPTFASRAMGRILAQALPDKSLHPPPSAVQLIALTSNGDLRAAVNSLQMLCSRTRNAHLKRRKLANGHSASVKRRGPGSRGGKGQKLDVSDDLRAVLDAVTRKEQSLNLFHALGKVLYNKRLGDPGEEEEDQEKLSDIKSLPPDDPLPSHHSHHTRRKSLLQMESFIPTIPTDASSFALWLHQSLPGYCTDIDQYSQAIEDFCGADVMRADDDIWQSSPQAIAYALHLTIRGSLMALPSPVLRNHQKLTKPQFYESYRQEQENISSLGLAAAYLSQKAVKASQVLSERSLNVDHQEAAWGGVSSRFTLATDLIPMMIKIQNLSKVPLLPSSVQSLALPPYLSSSYSANDELNKSSMDIDQEDEGILESSLEDVGVNQVWDDSLNDEMQVDEVEIPGDEIEDWD